MKTIAIILGVLLATIKGPAQEQPPAHGSIYGIAIGSDGRPAKGVGLTATPLGVALGAMLPHIKTNDAGEFRFHDLPWWGRYTVYAEDEDAGYSIFSTGALDQARPPEVELTPEHPSAELKVFLPPKAGFLEIHLTNRQTGETIDGVEIDVMLPNDPAKLVFGQSCSSQRKIFLPPDQDLLLHVKSWGFREWDRSVGNGVPVRIASGGRLTLDVQLEPSQ